MFIYLPFLLHFKVLECNYVAYLNSRDFRIGHKSKFVEEPTFLEHGALL